jgi:hypothetical protein
MPREAPVAAAALLGLLASGCPPVVAMAVVSAAQPYYDAGDLRRSFNAKHAFVSLGCVEVAPSLRIHDDALVLDWHMGNPCNEPVPVNLAKLAVYGTTDGGIRGRMKLFDPSDEIRELDLPARRLVYEPVELTADFTPVRVCLDLERLEVGAVNPPGELCFVKEGREWETEHGGGS